MDHPEKARNATLDLVRVIGITFIMFVHAPGLPDPAVDPAVFLLKAFLGAGASPAFFMLSGYLGARRVNPGSWGFQDHLKDRFQKLVLPLLFWNSLLLVGVLSLKYFGLDSLFQGQGAYFNVDLSASSIANGLLGIGWDPVIEGRRPIGYQFWFIRDLIVVSIVAFLIVRHLPKIPLLEWLLFFIPVPMASSLGFYLLGHRLAGVFRPEDFPSPRRTAVYCVAWLSVGCFLGTGVMSMPFLFRQLGSAAFIFGVALLAAQQSSISRLALLGPAVFFVIATHEPLQTILSKIWHHSGLPGYETILSLLLIPAMAYMACATAYFLIRKVAPRPLALATGGRA